MKIDKRKQRPSKYPPRVKPDAIYKTNVRCCCGLKFSLVRIKGSEYYECSCGVKKSVE